MLRKLGMAIEEHHKWFKHEEEDTAWIRACAQKDWIILSGDKGLETVPRNRQAIIDNKCKVFIFSDTNSKAEQWAAAVIMGRVKICNVVRKNIGPFVVTIGKEAHDHIRKPRFLGVGRPMTGEEILDSEPREAATEPVKRVPASREPAEPAQTLIKYPPKS